MSDRARQASQVVLTCAARFVLGFLTTVLATRELGPDGRGAFAVITTVSTVVQIAGHLSIDASNASLWSRRLPDHGAIATNSLLLGTGVGTLCAVGTGLVAWLCPALLPVPDRMLLAVALAAIPCSMTCLLLNNVLALRGRMEAVNGGGLLGACLYCVTLVVVSTTGRLTLAWAVAMWTLSAAAPLAVLVPTARPSLRDADRALARQAVTMGLRYHSGRIALYLLLRVDVLILSAYTSNATVGLYSVAVLVMDWARMLADSIAQVTLHNQMGRDHDSAADLTVRTTRLITPLTIGAVAAVCAAAPVLIPVVYGPAFRGSAAPLLALAPGLVAMGAARTINTFLLRLHRPLATSAVAFVALVLNVGLNLILIPAGGIVGCALASSIAYCALAGMQIAWFLRVTGQSSRDLVPGVGEVRYLHAALTQFSGALAARLRRGTALPGGAGPVDPPPPG